MDYINQGLSKNEAIKTVAKNRKLAKNEVYQIALTLNIQIILQKRQESIALNKLPKSATKIAGVIFFILLFAKYTLET